MLLSAQSTHVAITKLKDRVAELEVSDDYLAAYNTLKEAMYNFERATFFLTEGIRTLLPRFLNKAGEFAQEGIRLSEKTIEFHARASIRKKESSKIKVCPECRGKWRRVVDNWQIIGGCESCGYSEVEEELEPRPSGIRDNWDGVIDNVERILEAKVSKQGWTF